MNKTFLGLADVYLKRYGAPGPLRPVGSVSQCNLTHAEQEVRARNYGREGGTLNSVRRLDTVGVALTFQSLSVMNLADMLRGSVSDLQFETVTDEVLEAAHNVAVPLAHQGVSGVVVTNAAGDTTYSASTDYTLDAAAGTITALSTGTITDEQSLRVSYTHNQIVDEEHEAYKGALIRLGKIDATHVVVTSEDGNTTYVDGVAYRRTSGGIVVLADGPIADEQTIKVSYRYGRQQVIEALTQGQGEYCLTFDGVNEAENNQSVVVDLHRIKFGLPQSLAMIGDDFARMEATGELLLDPAQTGLGASKFYRWIYPGAAA
jgi:hypothetical protein